MTSTNSVSDLPLPPGKFGLPFLGEALSFLRDPQFAQKRHQQYGSTFKTSLFGQPTIFMRGAEAMRFLFSNEEQYFTVSWPDTTRALLGKQSLPLQTGGEHQSRRKLLAQAFMPRALGGYIETMETISDRYLQRWTQLKQFAWYPELRNYTLDIACQLLVGLDDGSQTPLGESFETWCQGLFALPINLPWTKLGRALRCRQQLLAQIESIVRQRQVSDSLATDALGLLIKATDEDGNSLSLEELKDQILNLLFAGHETLTSAIASFCLLTAQHPEILAELRAEQKKFPPAEPLTLEQLKQMTYLDRVLKEVLRFVPPVGGGFRRVLQTCNFNGYQLPQGWNILYQIGPTHQDDRIYPQPERFDPDRFSERASAEQKYGYVPFGGGVRECLGKEFARLEMKIFAARLLRDYDWQLLPSQNLEMSVMPTPHPIDGLKVNFQQSTK
ncbi:MAG: cytochrome P450 [Cyanosarcina radialis HA8281-LM2]|jgi:cytochrome P450|nr:cytochrome P450 [Cyanosarcina radialis HA8281-LM2]